MYRILREKNLQTRDALIGFAQELIRTPSTSLDEGRVADQVEARMRAMGYDKVLRDDVGNVVGILFGREAAPTLLLNSHLDTVPAAAEGWRDAPLAGAVNDGLLHGLGAADCKGGLAAQIYAGNLLKRSLLPLRGNLVMAATTAEENGRSVGVRTLLEKTLPDLGLKPSYAILGEPTGLGLYYGHDGWLEIDVRIEGVNPFQVDDAAQAVFQDFETGLRRAAPPGLEGVSVRQPRFDEALGLRRACIPMHRRLNATEDVGRVIEQVRHEAALVARPVGAVAVAVEVRQETQKLYTGQTRVVKSVTHAWSTDPFAPVMERARQALMAADCKVRCGRWMLDRLGMGTAGGVLVQEFGIPTIGYGPGDEQQAHAVNETVPVQNIVEAAYGTAAIAHGLIGVPVFGWTSDEI